MNEHNNLHQLVCDYIERLKERKARIEGVLDRAKNGSNNLNACASMLITRRQRKNPSLIGITPALKESFKALMSGIVNGLLLCSFSTTDDSQTAPVTVDGVTYVYTEACLAPRSERDSLQESPVLLPIESLRLFTDVDDPTVVIDGLISLSFSDIMEFIVSEPEFRFIAVDKSLNSFDFSCLN